MTVHGATTAELQALLNSLLAQVAALQAQLGSATPATSGASATLLASGDLTLGSKGAAVKELQMFLNAMARKLPLAAQVLPEVKL